MTRRRGLLVTITVALMVCGAGGLWLHTERQQYDRNRALIAALEKSDIQTALVLVNMGADPNTPQNPPPSPSLTQLLQHLLHHTPPPANGSSTAFLLACYPDMKTRAGRFVSAVSEESKLPLLRAMLSHGANVNARGGAMGTALETAVLIQNPHVVELLLGHGADANIHDVSNRTPLMVATGYNATDMVRLLLAHGANPNVQDVLGNTALFYAEFSPNPKDLIPVLMAHGANPNLPNKQGETPLHMVQLVNRFDLVRLMKHGTGR